MSHTLRSSHGGTPISTNSPQTAIPFGKYVLIKRLAVGGMAELFLAQEPPKPELVVLKRILPYLSEEPEFVQMFLDEARIAAQLHHPNIVQVYELGKLDNTIFIAMEFVEGVDLRRVVQEESKFGATVPYGVAAAICSQVAEGLDYAHFSKGVDGVPLELIHRDISPQNVMIAYSGRVKIVDFGIAKAGTYVNRSKPGVIKGKFLYLSPEQVAQDKLDHRADIFALGTMMYEITTGKSPFAKPTTEGILYAIRSEDPSPPHLLKDDYPTELSRIIMRCLVKDRSQRYQRASEVQADLDALLTSGGIRQSTDIPEYIARLMGEEEERTVLHIPVAASAGRKEATQAMSPGLAARPMRRPTAEGVPAAPDYNPNEPEPPTQMTRPPASPSVHVEEVEEIEEIEQANDFEDEAEERTAVGTMPVGFRPPEPGESTVQERGRGRAPSSPGATTPPVRRSNPALARDTEPRARRPATPPSRRPLTEDDEASQSISLTQPTLNQRLRRAAGADEDEDEGEGAEQDEGAESVSVTPQTTGQRRRFVDDAAADEAVTASTTGNRRRLAEDPDSISQPTLNQRTSRQRKALPVEAPEPEADSAEPELDDDADPTEGIQADAEDDESTAGYEQEELASSSRGRGLILIGVAVAVLLVLGVGLYWAFSSPSTGAGDSGGPQPAVPMGAPKGQTPTGEASPSKPEAAPGTPTPATGATTVAAAGGQNPAATDPSKTEPSGAGTATPPDNSTGGAAGPGDTGTAKANDPQPSGGANPGATPGPVAAKGTTPDSGKPAPATPGKPKNVVSVVFKTGSALIRVNGQRVEPNKVLTYPPGKITVEWSCPPKRRREGSYIKHLKMGQKEPVVYTTPCRKSLR
ncbi:MAG: protein kinase domain-containing protein [Hyalangium sp.]|uniref:protein kinase domain-containing protein n=1 Tax=Hyalangium sp. TaxID=2028555 RepID=UPI00389A9BCC